MFLLGMYMEQKNKYLPSNEKISEFINKYCVLKPRLNLKERANAVLRYAVWSGKIKKPSACSRCGENTKRICGHHHNGYSKKHALDVVWLCDRCHSIAHLR